MLQAGLTEMDICGDYFTWCNRHTTDTIHSRIDKLIGNVEWFKQNSDITLNILPPSVSDHALLHVVKDMQSDKRTRRFKFYNCITDLAGYEEVVSNCWNNPMDGNPMFILWRKLQRLKPVLKRDNMSNMKHNLETTRKDLELAQIDLSQNTMDGDKVSRVNTCTEKVLRLQDLEDQMLMQRAKIDWMKLSDENNTYFHATLKAKHKNKSLRMLRRADGSFVSKKEDVMKEVMTFYQRLMGTKDDKLKHVDIEAMRKG